MEEAAKAGVTVLARCHQKLLIEEFGKAVLRCGFKTPTGGYSVRVERGKPLSSLGQVPLSRAGCLMILAGEGLVYYPAWPDRPE